MLLLQLMLLLLLLIMHCFLLLTADVEIENGLEREKAREAVIINSDSNIKLNINDPLKQEDKELVCKDIDNRCNQYLQTSERECFINPKYMLFNCAKSCNTCDALLNRTRFCSREHLSQVFNLPNIVNSAIPTLQLNNVFDSILNGNSKYRKRGKIKVLSKDPYIITIDNFLTKIEMTKLLEQSERWGNSLASTTLISVEGKQVDVKYAKRNSNTGWCMEKCCNNTFVKRIFKKIEDLTNISRDNYENMQLVKYLEGQEYGPHNDYDGSKNVLSPTGPRILTLLVYMSEVEEGGETSFPELGLSVKPKLGMALVWPSVRNENLLHRENRTVHQAKPVIKGVKYVSNVWIHNWNFKLSFDTLCH